MKATNVDNIKKKKTYSKQIGTWVKGAERN